MTIAQQERIEELEEALWKIVQWSKAYPLKVFPEPDFKKVREHLIAGSEYLQEATISLDSISASNMRHVVEGVGKIAEEALR